MLFDAANEKGAREWRAFNAVVGDSVHVYDVRMPKKAVVIAQANHVLRITYPPVRTLRSV
ncbi:hypothetical protein A2680_00110 [Candidatus Kaiserbacteria bacterium RIFCSPHIGHO2_01_FULL_55_37]|nr:MAG: hypothetical protein A2680_00110 [Candidatus Kaiserbacteria bacterium RIFCSPHIGHO2_01_FULL_55_37]